MEELVDEETLQISSLHDPIEWRDWFSVIYWSTGGEKLIKTTIDYINTNVLKSLLVITVLSSHQAK